MWPASAGHVARITMAAQMGHAIETVTMSEVRNITIDNDAAKSITPQIKNANGRLSIRASRSVELFIPNMNDATRSAGYRRPSLSCLAKTSVTTNEPMAHKVDRYGTRIADV